MIINVATRKNKSISHLKLLFLGRKLCGNRDSNALIAHWVIAGTVLKGVTNIVVCVFLFVVAVFFSSYLAGIFNLQYLKHYRPFKDIPIFERFPVLICVAIIWIYSVILTAGGAYNHRPLTTQNSCRTDRANLISSAPWFSSSPFSSFLIFLIKEEGAVFTYCYM